MTFEKIKNPYGWTSFEQANNECLAAIHTLWSERKSMAKKLLQKGMDVLTVLELTELKFSDVKKIQDELEKVND